MIRFVQAPSRLFRYTILTGLLLISLIIVSTSAAQQVAAASQHELHWAPPILDNPVTINIATSGNNTINLDTDTDYILNMPDTPVTEALVIDGGHHVVMIGGEIDIPYQGIDPTISSRTGLKIRGATGIVHIEGLLIYGDDLSEGIQMNAPDAIVQIQNVRIEDIHARDQVDFSDNHPDLIQPYGNVTALRIDRLTGSTDYQGFLLKADFNGALGSVDISNVNITGNPTARYLIWIGEDGNADDIKFRNVYLDLPSGEHGTIGNAVWPHSGMPYPRQAQVINSENCTCVNWSADMRPRVRGIIRQGTPPQGDYVPRELVGIGYTPVGYGENPDDEAPPEPMPPEEDLPPPPLPPVASFDVECTDLNCTFTSTSSDSDGTVEGWSWELGDGAFANGAVVNHTYDDIGTYSINLIVSDDDAMNDSVTQDVTVFTTFYTISLSGTVSDHRGPDWTSAVTVTATDETGNPVSGVTVSGAFSDGAGTGTCTSDASGSCTFDSAPIRKGGNHSMSFVVSEVTNTVGYTYADGDSSVMIDRRGSGR